MIDYATGLMWQQMGSDRGDYKKVYEYIKQLNQDKFAGFSDWRLPSLEEAMSLMEMEIKGELYIDPVFDSVQRWVWTADKSNASAAWYVYFDYGHCVSYNIGESCHYVRAVRSVH